MADHVFPAGLSVADVYFLSRCVSNHSFGSEMKLRLATFGLMLLLWAAPAFSQGCAMCYSNATGTTKEGQRALSRGVLVLLIPPVGFMTLGVRPPFQCDKKRDEHLGMAGEMIGDGAASIVRASRKRNGDSFRFRFTGAEARVTF